MNSEKTVKFCQLPVMMKDVRCNTYCMLEVGHVGTCKPVADLRKQVANENER